LESNRLVPSLSSNSKYIGCTTGKPLFKEGDTRKL
jgi:hypothetical protein